MFSSKVNLMTGEVEWVTPEEIASDLQEDSDISKDLFRSQYGDMLHDTERNIKFCDGIKYAIKKVSDLGMEPCVLDIGTGTGLLSLMAAKEGAKKVTACEVLKPMAKIAKEIVRRNGYENVISVIPKRSTEMEVGPNGDMPDRANILVTEMFDTELIGEAALSTFIHAHKHLLKKGAVVVPQTATIIAQPVQSVFLSGSQIIQSDQFPFPLKIPSLWKQCHGPPSLWDIHVEEIPSDQIRGVAQPQQMLMFNFEDPDSLSLSGSSQNIQFRVTDSGVCHAIVMWWETQLAPGVILSTSPINPPQWRDHWLQCVHVLPHPEQVLEGDILNIKLFFDEYNVWFDVAGNDRLSRQGLPRVGRPICTCGAHMVWNRVRLSMLNEPERNSRLYTALQQILQHPSDPKTFLSQSHKEMSVIPNKVLVLSDGSLLSLMARSLGAEKVTAIEGVSLSGRTLNELIQENGCGQEISVIQKSATHLSKEDVHDEKFNIVIGEPFFHSSLLPWHNLTFWYALSQARESGIVSDDAHIMPIEAELNGILVHFKDLHKIKLPVGKVEGFDLSYFDDARDIPLEAAPMVTVTMDTNVEPHPLWEYPCTAKSKIFKLLSFDFRKNVKNLQDLSTHGRVEYTKERDVHAVVLWMDYQLTDQQWLRLQGPIEPPVVGEKITWSRSCRQSVVFLPFGQKSAFQNFMISSNQSSAFLHFSANFITSKGHMIMTFEIK